MQHFFCNFKTAENIIIQHKHAEEVSINNLILNEFKNDNSAFNVYMKHDLRKTCE